VYGSVGVVIGRGSRYYDRWIGDPNAAWPPVAELSP